jgi:hypothetical protein
MEKTEASMAELQVQLNTSYEFSRILGKGMGITWELSAPIVWCWCETLNIMSSQAF